MISNLDIYLAIARESLAESKAQSAAHRRPKPNGSAGRVITYDPTGRSFKASLVATVFACVYLDALLYIVGTERLGRRQYAKIKKKEFEFRIARLGINDSELLQSCKRLRQARNDIVHEKAADLSTLKNLRFAQDEAEHAITFVDQISRALAAT